MKTVAVIPSRYESSRFNGKPLAMIAGKPMIQRVYEQTGRASGIDRVVVATDDERICRAVEAFGGNAMITSRDNKSGTDRAAEAVRSMGLAPEDIVINVQGDQPLVDPRSIASVASPFLSDPTLDMSTLAFRIVREEEITNPKDVKVTFDREGFALYFSRSPIPFARDAHTVFDVYKHLGVYAYTKRFLDIFTGLPEGRLESIEKLEQLRALECGYRIKVMITEYDSPEVDVPEDVNRIEKMLSAQG